MNSDKKILKKQEKEYKKKIKKQEKEYLKQKREQQKREQQNQKIKTKKEKKRKKEENKLLKDNFLSAKSGYVIHRLILKEMVDMQVFLKLLMTTA